MMMAMASRDQVGLGVVLHGWMDGWMDGSMRAKVVARVHEEFCR